MFSKMKPFGIDQFFCPLHRFTIHAWGGIPLGIECNYFITATWFCFERFRIGWILFVGGIGCLSILKCIFVLSCFLFRTTAAESYAIWTTFTIEHRLIVGNIMQAFFHLFQELYC